MGWVVLGIIIGLGISLVLILCVRRWAWDGGFDEGFCRAEECIEGEYKAIMDGLTKKYDRELASLAQQHEDELIDLRRRCINYVVAMREADVAAGKEPFASMAFDIALGSVPLCVGKGA